MKSLLLLSSCILFFSCATSTSDSKANYQPGYPIKESNSTPSIRPQTVSESWVIDRVLPRNKRHYSRRSKSIGGGRFIPGGSIKFRGIRFFNAARPSRRNILIDKIESNSKRIKIKKTPVTGKITGAGTPELTEKIPTGNIMQEDGKIGVKGGGPPKF